jgi:lysozyme
MKISDAGIALIKSMEGLRLDAYPDPATGSDPWTIGYGHTGPEVRRGMTITEETAEQLLRNDCTKFEDCVTDALEVEVAQHQFDALVSFAFNVGCAAFMSSTMLKLLNAGNFEAAEQQFKRWDKAAGKVMAGLTRRRAAEADLFHGVA